MIITALTIVAILAAGLGMTFAAVRLVEQRDRPALMDSPDLVRAIVIVDTGATQEEASLASPAAEAAS